MLTSSEACADHTKISAAVAPIPAAPERGDGPICKTALKPLTSGGAAIQ